MWAPQPYDFTAYIEAAKRFVIRVPVTNMGVQKKKRKSGNKALQIHHKLRL